MLRLDVEVPRIRVTLATGIPEELLQTINLGYLHSATINPDEWKGRESEGVSSPGLEKCSPGENKSIKGNKPVF